MAYVTQVTDLRFRVDIFRTLPYIFVIHDLVGESLISGMTYETSANVRGLFKLVAPTGDILYENAGFADDDYDSPDIDGSESPAVFEKTFTVGALEMEDILLNNPGTYTLYIKISLDEGETTLGTTGTISTFNLSPTFPESEIENSIDYTLKRITAVDNTDYRLLNNGEYIDETGALDFLEYVEGWESLVEYDYKLKITYPDVSGVEAQVSTSKTFTPDVNLWTGNYLIEALNFVYYDIEEYADETVSCRFFALWAGETTATVLPNEGYEEIVEGIDTLYNQYIYFQNINAAEANIRKLKLDKINTLMTQATWLKFHGGDYQTKIQAVATVLGITLTTDQYDTIMPQPLT